jgi:hypothetical protein
MFNQSLAYGIEQLFQNMTLSLLSKSQYLAEAGQMTDVVLDRWLNVYAYDQKNLLISYGVALVLTLLACAVGCAKVYRNGVSYSNSFSTVLRTTRHLQSFDAVRHRMVAVVVAVVGLLEFFIQWRTLIERSFAGQLLCC